MSRPAVLMIAFHYPPCKAVGGLRPRRFVRYLGRLGFNVRVIAAGDEHRPSTIDNVQRLRGDLEESIPTFLEKVCRRLFWPHGWGAAWALATVWHARRFIQGSRPILISTAPPLATHFAAYILKRQHGLRWIADFRDPFVGHRGPAGLGRFDKRIENGIFRRADAIVANTDVVADLWRRQYPEFAHKIHVIWNSLDPEDGLRAEPIPQRTHKALVHVGALYGGRHPGPLLGSFERLAERHWLDSHPVRIRLVGSLEESTLPEPRLFQRLIDSGWMECTPSIPRAAARQIMSEADYLLLLDVLEGFSAGLQVPSKLFEYVRIGRPILACTTRDSALERVLSQSGVPHTMLYSDDPEEAIDRKVVEFFSLPTNPTQPSPEFESRFSIEAQGSRLCTLLEGDSNLRPADCDSHDRLAI